MLRQFKEKNKKLLLLKLKSALKIEQISNKCGHRNVLFKRQVWMSIFHIINFKKKKIVDTGVLDFLIKI
jgi:hypothetical protein